MEIDSGLYRAYLEELQALERFRITYSGLHPEVGLQRDDPDVRRLIEAMAVLTARSRLAGQKSATRTATRLFTQQLPHLLSPVPAVGIVQAVPEAGFVQSDGLAEGEGILIRGADRFEEGTPQEAPEALFRTLRPLQVLPIELSSVRSVRRDEGGRLLYLDFHSRHRRGWQVGDFSLLIDHLSELQPSATVFRALRNHLTRATVSFDRKLLDGTGDHVCKTTFGRPEGAHLGHELVDHPLQRARMFFRMPQQYMYMNLKMPECEDEWQDFTVCLELDTDWPRGLALTKESFKLNTVAVANLSRELTDPIDADGTKDRYLLSHPDGAGKFRPHSVAGAFLLDPEQGLVPLLSAAMPNPPGEAGAGTFEIEYEEQGLGRRAWTVLDVPGVLEEPQQVVADVFWYQPDLTRDRDLPEDIQPADRNLEAVKWGAIGPISPPVHSPILGDDEALLDLLAIKNLPVLERQGMLTVLDALRGTEPAFGQVISNIEAVEVKAAPYAHASAGIKQVYALRFGPLELALVPVLDLMGPRLREILHAWSTQEVVELEMSVPSLDIELAYRSYGESA